MLSTLTRSTCLAACLLSSAVVALAQTTPEIATFSQEVVIPLSQLGAATPPAIPANVLASIQSGAVQIRHSTIFVPSTRRLSVRTFLAPPSGPNPTPVQSINSYLESFEVDVQNVFFSTNPRSFLMVGRVVGGGQSPFTDFAGGLFTYSAGYNTETPVAFNNVTITVPGRYVMFATAGTGTLTFVGQPGTNPGGGTGDNRPPVANAGADVTTVQSEIVLDASGSTDPENTALTYRWRAVGKSAAVLDPNSRATRVQFAEGFGTYTFQVTVTDAAGATATDTVSVLYVGH